MRNDYAVPSSKKYQFYFIVLILFLILSIRLFQVQILEKEKYWQVSEDNRIRAVTIDAPRGLIMDRNGEIIVDNLPSYTVSVIPYEFGSKKKGTRDIVINRLSKIIGMSPEEIKKKIPTDIKLQYRAVKIKHNVDINIVSIVEEQNLNLPGVIVQSEPIRGYLYNDMAAHLLGYVGEVSEKELFKLAERGYQLGDVIGRSGIEEQYENYLRGQKGCIYEEVNALGQRVTDASEKPPILPKLGNNLVLTIDRKLQQTAERAFGNLRGGLVAIDPRNGEILAMVSRPTYNPELFAMGLTASIWKNLNENPTHPLLNRAIQSSYPPGSTFKIMTAIAGLEEKTISENKYFYCPGYKQYGGIIFPCWKSDGHGSFSLLPAITQSCDVYFYETGLSVGLERFSILAKKCHFGEKTGVDLPDEKVGLIPDMNYYNNRRKAGGEGWTPGKMLNLSIGQGEILVTPIQLSAFAGAVGNKGNYYTPHLLKEVRSPKGDVIEKYKPELKKLPVSEENLEIIKRGMIGVVQGLGEYYGTGGRARVDGVIVAGKTGTAQNPHGENHGLFMCFAPADNPTIAIGVVAENAGQGGVVAAPIAQKVMEEWFKREENRK